MLLVAATLAAVIAATVPAQAAVHPSAVAPAESVAGPYLILFLHSGQCLDVPGFSTENIQVTQYPCKHSGVDRRNQLWQFVWTDSGYARIRNVFSGKCLNVSGAAPAGAGAAVIQYPCGQAVGNDEWRGTPVQRVRGLDYYRLKARHLGAGCLNVSGGSMSPGGPVIQWTCQTERSQENDQETWFSPSQFP
jgi:galactose oxidase